MRSSAFATLVCLAVAVNASPTPAGSNSLEARDVWTPPARRDAFIKRVPEPEIEERDLDEHSPFTFEFSARTPSSGPVALSDTPSGNDLNARYPFFLKRGGNLEARDIQQLEARKVKIEKRGAAEQAKRDADELAVREAEDLEARELDLQLTRREFENTYLSRRDPQFGNFNLASILSSFTNGTTGGTSAGGNNPFGQLSALTNGRLGNLGGGNLNNLLSNFGFNLRRDEDLAQDLGRRHLSEARDFDDMMHLAKRDPQFGNFNLASILSSFTNGTSGGTGAGSNSPFGQLSALTNGRLGNLGGGNLNNILSNFGFNLRRDEDLLQELARRQLTEARDFDNMMYLSKRDPQFGNFNLASILSSFTNGTTGGTSAGGNSPFGQLSALTNGRLGNLGGGNLNSILSNFGFNLRRDQESVQELAMRQVLDARGLDEDLTYIIKRDPQFGNFNLASILSSFTNGTAGGISGTGGGNGALGSLSALTNGRLGNLAGGNLNSILSNFGFNFRREEDTVTDLFPREPAPFSLTVEDDNLSKREPFGLDAFVQAKRGY